MKEAVRTSEMSVDIQSRTQQYIPQDSELHTRRSENLKSHNVQLYDKWQRKHVKNILLGNVWQDIEDRTHE
jgi:hypothetical protein